ncbi:cytochrome c3 family protein [Carboxylicivirga sp. M1479]|uniref:cytochrome c3 family protein n=1 Tax=Carboxylicivirga sp. M1479 TaxID=2594476 RepID=UPI001177FE53|nr:cytochrome c3 family protein [Carboxylicivirga sp. M1479]TRX71066.1 cytochrome c3 family protein [Carboxylicivirga sp. M1479]
MVKTLSDSLTYGKKILKPFFVLCVLLALSGIKTEVFAEKKGPEPDIKVGERLFFGLIPSGEGSASCVSCHAVHSGDSINWNPSAVEMAKVAAEMDLATFKEHLLTPTGAMREKVHVKYQLDDEQLFHLQGYLVQLSENGVEDAPISINKLLIFLLLGGLMTFALVDLIFTKKIPYKAIHVLIIVFGLSFQLKLVAHETIDLGRSQDYMPDQPIKFSHKVHAGDNKIDCLYCHSNADEGKSSGIPSAGLCMNCHQVVRNGTNSGQFEIAKVVDAYENNKDIEWVRIHNLPDHVFFSHAQHVNVGKRECQECHGDVENMHILKQEHDLSMGWCLDCHKATNVNFKDNDYYKTFEALHKDLDEGVRDSIKAADIGANDCMKCHH